MGQSLFGILRGMDEGDFLLPKPNFLELGQQSLTHVFRKDSGRAGNIINVLGRGRAHRRSMGAISVYGKRDSDIWADAFRAVVPGLVDCGRSRKFFLLLFFPWS